MIIGELEQIEGSPDWCGSMPHPVRIKAKGRPTFTIGVMNWADDVSGNRTKQYNAHTNVYLASLNLPHAMTQQEYFVHFSATSPYASALELLDGLSDDFGPDLWHEAYDCELAEDILFRLIPRMKPADNPQQSELCSHIGMKGSRFCRRCKAGGNRQHTTTEDGYHALFRVSTYF